MRNSSYRPLNNSLSNPTGLQSKCFRKVPFYPILYCNLKWILWVLKSKSAFEYICAWPMARVVKCNVICIFPRNVSFPLDLQSGSRNSSQGGLNSRLLTGIKLWSCWVLLYCGIAGCVQCAEWTWRLALPSSGTTGPFHNIVTFIIISILNLYQTESENSEVFHTFCNSIPYF